MENLEERLFDNFFEIVGSLFDIFKLYTKDDSCYTDMELMSEIYRFHADLGELAAAFTGFDYKWDQSVERKHIKKHAFHVQMKEAIKKLNEQYKNMDPMIMMFPDLQPIFESLEKFFQDFRKMMTPPKIHHNKQLPQKSSWKMPTHHTTSFKDLFKMPTHQAKKTVQPTHQYKDPVAEMFKGMFRSPVTHHKQPVYHQQKSSAKWGQVKMPIFDQHQFDEQFKKFSNFKLF